MDSDEDLGAEASRNFSIDDLEDDDDFGSYPPVPADAPSDFGDRMDLASFHNRVTLFDSGWCSGSEWRDRCSNPYTLRIFVVLCVCAFLISLVVAAVSGNYVGDADKSQASVAMVVMGIIFMLGFLVLLVILIRRLYFANQVEEF